MFKPPFQQLVKVCCLHGAYHSAYTKSNKNYKKYVLGDRASWLRKKKRKYSGKAVLPVF